MIAPHPHGDVRFGGPPDCIGVQHALQGACQVGGPPDAGRRGEEPHGEDLVSAYEPAAELILSAMNGIVAYLGLFLSA